MFIIFLFIPFENKRTTRYILKINVFYYHKNKIFRPFKRKNTFIRKREDGRNHGFGFKSPHQWPNEPEENTVHLHLLKGSRLTD